MAGACNPITVWKGGGGDVAELVQTFLGHIPYVGLFLVLLACGLGLPLPEDVPLVLAGYLVQAQGKSEFLMICVGMLGVLAGDSVLFAFGRKYGESITEHRFMRRLTTPARVNWAEQQYEKRGTIIMFAARFMPGARAVLFMTAGIFRVKYWKFVLIDGIAAAISVPVWILLGSRLGPEVMKRAEGHAKLIIFGLLGLALVGWGVWEWRQHRKRKQEQIAYALTHPRREPRPDKATEAPAETSGDRR